MTSERWTARERDAALARVAELEAENAKLRTQRDEARRTRLFAVREAQSAAHDREAVVMLVREFLDAEPERNFNEEDWRNRMHAALGDYGDDEDDDD